MKFTSLIKKRSLLLAAIVFIAAAFWLSTQGAGSNAPTLIRVETGQLISGLHELDKLLIRYPSKGRALRGFYLEPTSVKLGNFEIDACEVSQSDYGRFLQWRQLHRPKQIQNSYMSSLWSPPGLEKEEDWLSRTRDHKFLGRNDVPVTGIRPAAAQAYCRFMGGNLPTEFEWEAAASGPEQHLYPWGNDAPATTRLFHDPILNVARACNSDPGSNTPLGLSDMGSGASNLTLIPIQNLPPPGSVLRQDEQYVLKGGGWRQPDAIHSLNFLRAPASGDLISNYVTFRCAYPAYSRRNNRPGRSLISPWRSTSTTVFIPEHRYSLARPKGSVLLQLSASVNTSQYLGLIDQAEQAKDASTVYYVTESEVTVQQYQQFLENPIAQMGFYDHPVQPGNHTHTPLRWQGQLASPDKPVRGIDWWSAMAYADWLGGTLLSEQEWMLLAGGLSRSYPDVSGLARGVLRDPDYFQQLHAALDGSNDISTSSLIGLGGNVMEWTRTIIPGSSLNFILKGGSYRTPGESARVANASFAPPEYASMDLGFRVVFYDRPSWSAPE